MTAPEGDSFVSDGTHSGNASHILWGDQGPAFVQGWTACAETIATLLEVKAAELAASTPRLRDRILHPAMAEIYRHAAEIARATTEVTR